jgi:hypothetical protein
MIIILLNSLLKRSALLVARTLHSAGCENISLSIFQIGRSFADCFWLPLVIKILHHCSHRGLSATTTTVITASVCVVSTHA